MSDRILEAFLARQYEEGMELAGASSLLELSPLGGRPPRAYHARFRANGLVRASDGSIARANRFEVMIVFPEDYLRRVDPRQVLIWLGPPDVWHPNIAYMAPMICAGRLAPATPLVDLLYQVFEMITWNRYTPHDALNPDAGAWAIQHKHVLPVDRRPLRNRNLPLEVIEI